MLKPADHQAADFGIARGGIVGAKVDGAGLIGRETDFRVKPRPALGIDLPLQGGAHFVLRLRPEFDRDELFGAGRASRG